MSTQTERPRRGPKPNPATRANLLGAGMRLFHESGYNATGIKDIVEAAGVPKGSFYNHFVSKESFAVEVTDAYFSGSLRSLKAILVDPAVPALERLHSYFDKRSERLRETGYTRGCLLGNLSLEVADHSPEISGHLADHFGTWAALFEQCIVEAQETGAITTKLPASLLAQFLLNSWEGALLRARTEKSDTPLNQFREVVFTTILA